MVLENGTAQSTECQRHTIGLHSDYQDAFGVQGLGIRLLSGRYLSHARSGSAASFGSRASNFSCAVGWLVRISN